MACEVGADVPFFLTRTPMRVTGIGDKLTPCSVSLPGSEILLVTPDIRVSTPWAYKAFDGMVPGFSVKPASPAQTVPATLTTTHEEDKGVSLLCTPGNAFVNDLETAVFSRYPELADIKRSLLESGAAAASYERKRFQHLRNFLRRGGCAQCRKRAFQKLARTPFAYSYWDVAKRSRQRVLAPLFEGSIPSIPAITPELFTTGRGKAEQHDERLKDCHRNFES